MTKSKKMVSLLLTATLMVSILAVNASAATVTGETGYQATVTCTSTSKNYIRACNSLVDHTNGIADVIYHPALSYTSPYYVPSMFPSAYRTGLCTAFEKAGFRYQVSCSKESGTIAVIASRPSGVYEAAYEYITGGGPWNVMVNSVKVNSGSFGGAPRSVKVVPHLI